MPDGDRPTWRDVRDRAMGAYRDAKAQQRPTLGIGTLFGPEGTARGRITFDDVGLYLGDEPVVWWADATALEVTGQEKGRQVTRGSERKPFHVLRSRVNVYTSSAAETQLTVRTAERVYSLTIAASPAKVRGMLGDVIADIDRAD